MSKEFNLTQLAEINESLIENQLPQLDKMQSRIASGQDYEELEIDFLTQAFLQPLLQRPENSIALIPTQFSSEYAQTELNNLLEDFASNQSSRPEITQLLLPVSVNNGHFAALQIVRNGNAFSVNYVDPLGQNTIPPHLAASLEQSLEISRSEIRSSSTILQAINPENGQVCNNDCGSFVINLLNGLASDTVRLDSGGRLQHRQFDTATGQLSDNFLAAPDCDIDQSNAGGIFLRNLHGNTLQQVLEQIEIAQAEQSSTNLNNSSNPEYYSVSEDATYQDLSLEDGDEMPALIDSEAEAESEEELEFFDALENDQSQNSAPKTKGAKAEEAEEFDQEETPKKQANPWSVPSLLRKAFGSVVALASITQVGSSAQGANLRGVSGALTTTGAANLPFGSSGSYDGMTNAVFTPPTLKPTLRPSGQPTNQPSRQPSGQPSGQPSAQPTRKPTSPTSQPSGQPSGQPSNQPSRKPSGQPTAEPTSPTRLPTTQPSNAPSTQPFAHPSGQPSTQPSTQPSKQPFAHPSSQPSTQPTEQPTEQPTTQPSAQPIFHPTTDPTAQPTTHPTGQPSGQPTNQPFGQPTSQPSGQPIAHPTNQPSGQPFAHPTGQPSEQPTSQPSAPSSQPTSQPSNPSSQPTSQPSNPSSQPTSQPSNPSSQPTSQPSRFSSPAPTPPAPNVANSYEMGAVAGSIIGAGGAAIAAIALGEAFMTAVPPVFIAASIAGAGAFAVIGAGVAGSDQHYGQGGGGESGAFTNTTSNSNITSHSSTDLVGTSNHGHEGNRGAEFAIAATIATAAAIVAALAIQHLAHHGIYKRKDEKRDKNDSEPDFGVGPESGSGSNSNPPFIAANTPSTITHLKSATKPRSDSLNSQDSSADLYHV